MSYAEASVPGFSQLKILAVNQTAEALDYSAELIDPLTKERKRCSKCDTRLQRVGYGTATLYDLPRGLMPTKIVIRWGRWRCPNKCEQPSALAGIQALGANNQTRKRGRALTQRLQDELLRRYSEGETVPQLSAWCGVGQRPLWDIISSYMAVLREAPRNLQSWRTLTHIGIDELFWRGQILCVLLDLVSGQIIDILPDRDPVTVSASFRELKSVMSSLGRPHWSPTITTDMWEDYRQVAYKVFGRQARVVADGFHLRAKISEDFRSEALAVLQEAGLAYQERGKVLQFLHDQYLQSLKQRVVPQQLPPELQNLDGELARRLRILFIQTVQLGLIWQASSRTQAEAQYNQWVWEITRYAYPQEPPFRRLRYLIDQWRSEVFAAYDEANALPDGRKPSNGPVEGLNSRLRRLAKHSHASSHNSFAKEQSQLQEAEHYQRFRLRALLMAGGLEKIPEAGTVHSHYHASGIPETCSCRRTVRSNEVRWQPVGSAFDVPLGQSPVKATFEVGEYTCPQCSLVLTTKQLSPPKVATDALKDYLRLRRLDGASKRTLMRESGLIYPQLEPLLPPLPPHEVKELPSIVGILRWRWRKQLYWVITDPRQSRLVDLLPMEGKEDADKLSDLMLWLYARAQPTTQLLPERAEWANELEQTYTCALDPLTTKRMLQRALIEVQRRFTDAIPVASRRMPRFHRHRRLILSRSHNLNEAEKQRLKDILVPKSEMRRAYMLTHIFHEVYDKADSNGWPEKFGEWSRKVAQLASTEGNYPDAPIKRSLVFGFRDVQKSLQSHQTALAAGLDLRREGITLGGSRQLLQQLKGLEAAQQPDFALLRYAALQRLGVCNYANE